MHFFGLRFVRMAIWPSHWHLFTPSESELFSGTCSKARLSSLSESLALISGVGIFQKRRLDHEGKSPNLYPLVAPLVPDSTPDGHLSGIGRLASSLYGIDKG